jgi:hypothetical protein
MQERTKLVAVWAAIFLVFGGLLWAVVAVALKERKQWDDFAAAHACKKVSVVRGDVQVAVTTGMDSKGNLVTATTPIVTPDKVAYMCDDGVTYWR